MIPIEAVEKYVEAKVITKGALEEATKTGWRLIAALVDEGPVFEDQYGHLVIWNYGNGEPVSFKRLLFLVGRDRDTTVADLAAERDKLREEINETSDRLDEARKEAATQAASFAASFVAGKKVMTDYEIQGRALKGLSEKVQKMEADLAKVRQAIGERTFKEIVG